MYILGETRPGPTVGGQDADNPGRGIPSPPDGDIDKLVPLPPGGGVISLKLRLSASKNIIQCKTLLFTIIALILETYDQNL